LRFLSQEVGLELGEAAASSFLLILFHGGFGKEPFDQVDTLLSFDDVLCVGVIGVVSELLVATWFLLTLHALALIKDVFKNVYVASLELLVFNNTSGK
jgi:hypothetical protein